MARKLNGVDDDILQRMSAPYKQSEQVNQEGIEASNAYQSLKNWRGSGKAQAAKNKWKNTGPFAYDPDSDSLYQSAKANAIANGKVAMQDTTGQASAMTGGYGNSYAATAGSQAYQNYLKSLDDDLATYYQLALDQYQQSKDDLLTEYSIENEIDNTDYSRLYNLYGLAQDRYNNDRAFDYGQYSDDYQRYASLANMQNSDYWNQQNFDEGKRQFDTNLAENQRQFDTNFAENQRQFDTNFAEGQRQFNTSLSAGGSENGFTSQQYWNVIKDVESMFSEVTDDESRNEANEAALKRISTAYEAGQMTDDDYVALLDEYIDENWLVDNHLDVVKDNHRNR